MTAAAKIEIQTALHIVFYFLFLLSSIFVCAAIHSSNKQFIALFGVQQFYGGPEEVQCCLIGRR